jgi:Dock homology region 2
MYLNSGRLAEIMRHQAALLEHIITTQRYYPDYFRVAFYGNFPVAIRNKQFIVCCDLRHHTYGAYTDVAY